MIGKVTGDATGNEIVKKSMHVARDDMIVGIFLRTIVIFVTTAIKGQLKVTVMFAM